MWDFPDFSFDTSFDVPQVDIPSFDLPSVNIPDISIPTVTVPDYPLTTVPDYTGMPIDTGVPKMDVTEIVNDALPGEAGYGWKYYSDGVSIDPNGNYYTSTGPVAQPQDFGTLQSNGSITYKDGTEIFSDGSVMKPDGTVVSADGSMEIKPDGTVIENGVQTGGQGSAVELAKNSPSLLEKAGSALGTFFKNYTTKSTPAGTMIVPRNAQGQQVVGYNAQGQPVNAYGQVVSAQGVQQGGLSSLFSGSNSTMLIVIGIGAVLLLNQNKQR